MTTARWEHFEHGSDIASSVEAAFEQSAVALTAVCVDPSSVAEAIQIEIACEASSLALLLVAWLDAVIYEMSVRRVLFSCYVVDRILERELRQLRAHAFGENVDARRHAPAVEIKGATFCALSVTSDKGIWVAQCVVDV